MCFEEKQGQNKQKRHFLTGKDACTKVCVRVVYHRGCTTVMVISHKQDVFEAIRDSLLEVGYNNNLNYSKLYESVNEKLKLFRKKPRVRLSTRDFDSEINILLKEGLILRRIE
jgi:hypothetical protein